MLFHEQFCKNEAFSVEISAISECPRLFSPKLLTQRQMLGDCRHKFCGHILVFGAEPLTSCLSLSFRRHADLSATNVMSVSPTWCGTSITSVIPLSSAWCRCHQRDVSATNVMSVPPTWSQCHQRDASVTNMMAVSSVWHQYHQRDTIVISMMSMSPTWCRCHQRDVSVTNVVFVAAAAVSRQQPSLHLPLILAERPFSSTSRRPLRPPRTFRTRQKHNVQRSTSGRSQVGGRMAVATALLHCAFGVSHGRLLSVLFANCRFVCWRWSTDVACFRSKPKMWPRFFEKFISLLCNMFLRVSHVHAKIFHVYILFCVCLTF